MGGGLGGQLIDSKALVERFRFVDTRGSAGNYGSVPDGQKLPKLGRRESGPDPTMDVFDSHSRLVEDYASTRAASSRSQTRASRRRSTARSDDGALWPEPLLQLNPTFLPGGTIDDLVADGTLHPECTRIFRIDKSDSDHSGKQLLLHTHQTEAIRKAKEGKSYVLTSGTGSGKSLTYIVPIVDHVLRRGSGQGIQAIVVYPMNALANSQAEELKKFLEKGYGAGQSPVRFARYTGQEKGARARGDPEQSAGRPAHELHDAGAAAHATRGSRARQSGTGAAVPGVRRAAHLPRATGRGRCAADPTVSHRVRRARHHLRRHVGHDGQRGHVGSTRSGKWRRSLQTLFGTSVTSAGHRRDPGAGNAGVELVARSASTSLKARACRPLTTRAARDYEAFRVASAVAVGSSRPSECRPKTRPVGSFASAPRRLRGQDERRR